MNNKNLRQRKTAPTRETHLAQFLLESADLIPVDNVDEFPRILVELELKLPFFVNDQLGRWVENATALILVGIVNLDLARC
jgi:hypothetical protein